MQKLVLILSLMFSLTTKAQKVDLDRSWLRFNYTRLQKNFRSSIVVSINIYTKIIFKNQQAF